MTTQVADRPAWVVTHADQNDSAFLVKGEGAQSSAPGVWILRGHENSIVFALDARLVLVDSGLGGRVTEGMITALRKVSDAPIHAIGFSHGHLAYNGGPAPWLVHGQYRGNAAPRCMAHANLPRRTARCRHTMVLQERLAAIQLRRETHSMAGKLWVAMPAETFTDSLLLGERGVKSVERLGAVVGDLRLPRGLGLAAMHLVWRACRDRFDSQPGHTISHPARHAALGRSICIDGLPAKSGRRLPMTSATKN